MTNTIKQHVWLLCWIAASLTATAQAPVRGCATPAFKSERLLKYQQGLIPRVEKSANIQYVPMQFFFVGNDDGSSSPNPLEVFDALELLNFDFTEMNIQFFIKDIAFINNTSYNDHNFARGAEMMLENNVRDAVNVYFVENPAGACGYYSPRRDAVAMGIACIGPGDRTFSHELGHYLSLPHTFFGWECVENIDSIPDPAPEELSFPDFPDCDGQAVERLDSTNCTTAGDGFCDTPPDYLMERWRCDAGGIFPDSLTDPSGRRFIVTGENIMSYANDACVNTFSEEQKGAMLTELDSRLGLVDNSNPSLVPANADDLVQIAPENNEQLPVSDFVELAWNNVPNADYYVVQVHTSSNLNGAVLITEITRDTTLVIETLQARRRYWWRVRPVNSYETRSEFGTTRRFRNGEFTTSTIDQALDAAITIAPNPLSGGRPLRISGRELGKGGQLDIALMNAAGQIVAIRQQSAPAAGFNEHLSTEGLPAGIYFLRLRLDERLVTRRIVLTP